MPGKPWYYCLSGLFLFSLLVAERRWMPLRTATTLTAASNPPICTFHLFRTSKKRGNVKKCSPPLYFFTEFYVRSKGTPQSAHTTFASRVARMIAPHSGQTYLILRFLDFLLPPLAASSTGRRLALILSSPNISLIHASASGASVVTVHPYLSCFSMRRPWASATALNFRLLYSFTADSINCSCSVFSLLSCNLEAFQISYAGITPFHSSFKPSLLILKYMVYFK